MYKAILYIAVAYILLYKLKGALDKLNIIPKFFQKKLRFLYHKKCWHE